jgi:secreted protein with Ig-like and vWFA domain
MLPYLETVTVGSGAIRVKINFVITAAVAYNNTAGALDGLEKLIISILTALPLGYVVGDVQRPTIQSVGASNLLIADLSVSTFYTQT